MTRQIPWSLHSETGVYNKTFLDSNIQQYLDFFTRYYDVAFPRSNDGRIKFIHARQVPTPGVAMWTNRSTFRTWISPVFNFKKHNLVCCQCILHEFGHMCSNLAHLPANIGALMGPNANCTNLVKADYQYFPYPWKSSLRPDQEPLKMKQTFGTSTLAGLLNWSPTPIFGCGNDHSLQKPLLYEDVRTQEIDWDLVP